MDGMDMNLDLNTWIRHYMSFIFWMRFKKPCFHFGEI